LKLAAIDIGSNAIRMQITHVLEYQGVTNFKKMEYLRFPLRLGQDVFSTGKISEAKQVKFKKLMNAFKILIDLYEVDDHYACATSAMRESSNGMEVCQAVREECGLDIHIIEGELEAELINRSLLSLLDDGVFLHIDVGGGSTEFNLYQNKKVILSRSFRIGSVRRLEHHDIPGLWEEMEKWLKDNVKNKYRNVTTIGTGGNITKAFELAGKKPGKPITRSRLQSVQGYIREFSIKDRINFLQLNPDRADVIIPALDIYISAMKWSGALKMLVPDIGLKDGLMHLLYERVSNKKLQEM